MRILTSTGRGSYVDPMEVSLDEILARYDRCPSTLIDEPRHSVISAYSEALKLIEELAAAHGP